MDFEELTDRITFRQKRIKRITTENQKKLKKQLGLAGPELEEQL